MKLQKLIPVIVLLLLSVAALSAQNLPNPHDDACWASVDALRACELQVYNQALDQAQRCNSYPEYQCLPAAKQSEQKIAGKHSVKAASQTADNTSSGGVSPAVPSDAQAGD